MANTASFTPGKPLLGASLPEISVFDPHDSRAAFDYITNFFPMALGTSLTTSNNGSTSVVSAQFSRSSNITSFILETDKHYYQHLFLMCVDQYDKKRVALDVANQWLEQIQKQQMAHNSVATVTASGTVVSGNQPSLSPALTPTAAASGQSGLMSPTANALGSGATTTTTAAPSPPASGGNGGGGTIRNYAIILVHPLLLKDSNTQRTVAGSVTPRNREGSNDKPFSPEVHPSLAAGYAGSSTTNKNSKTEKDKKDKKESDFFSNFFKSSKDKKEKEHDEPHTHHSSMASVAGAFSGFLNGKTPFEQAESRTQEFESFFKSQTPFAGRVFRFHLTQTRSTVKDLMVESYTAYQQQLSQQLRHCLVNRSLPNWSLYDLLNIARKQAENNLRFGLLEEAMASLGAMFSHYYNRIEQAAFIAHSSELEAILFYRKSIIDARYIPSISSIGSGKSSSSAPTFAPEGGLLTPSTPRPIAGGGSSTTSPYFSGSFSHNISGGFVNEQSMVETLLNIVSAEMFICLYLNNRQGALQRFSALCSVCETKLEETIDDQAALEAGTGYVTVKGGLRTFVNNPARGSLTPQAGSSATSSTSVNQMGNLKKNVQLPSPTAGGGSSRSSGSIGMTRALSHLFMYRLCKDAIDLTHREVLLMGPFGGIPSTPAGSVVNVRPVQATTRKVTNNNGGLATPGSTTPRNHQGPTATYRLPSPNARRPTLAPQNAPSNVVDKSLASTVTIAVKQQVTASDSSPMASKPATTTAAPKPQAESVRCAGTTSSLSLPQMDHHQHRLNASSSDSKAPRRQETDTSVIDHNDDETDDTMIDNDDHSDGSSVYSDTPADPVLAGLKSALEGDASYIVNSDQRHSDLSDDRAAEVFGPPAGSTSDDVTMRYFDPFNPHNSNYYDDTALSVSGPTQHATHASTVMQSMSDEFSITVGDLCSKAREYFVLLGQVAYGYRLRGQLLLQDPMSLANASVPHLVSALPPTAAIPTTIATLQPLQHNHHHPNAMRTPLEVPFPSTYQPTHENIYRLKNMSSEKHFLRNYLDLSLISAKAYRAAGRIRCQNALLCEAAQVLRYENPLKAADIMGNEVLPHFVRSDWPHLSNFCRTLFVECVACVLFGQSAAEALFLHFAKGGFSSGLQAFNKSTSTSNSLTPLLDSATVNSIHHQKTGTSQWIDEDNKTANVSSHSINTVHGMSNVYFDAEESIEKVIRCLLYIITAASTTMNVKRRAEVIQEAPATFRKLILFARKAEETKEMELSDLFYSMHVSFCRPKNGVHLHQNSVLGSQNNNAGKPPKSPSVASPHAPAIVSGVQSQTIPASDYEVVHPPKILKTRIDDPFELCLHFLSPVDLTQFVTIDESEAIDLQEGLMANGQRSSRRHTAVDGVTPTTTPNDSRSPSLNVVDVLGVPGDDGGDHQQPTSAATSGANVGTNRPPPLSPRGQQGNSRTGHHTTSGNTNSNNVSNAFLFENLQKKVLLSVEATFVSRKNWNDSNDTVNHVLSISNIGEMVFTPFGTNNNNAPATPYQGTDSSNPLVSKSDTQRPLPLQHSTVSNGSVTSSSAPSPMPSQEYGIGASAPSTEIFQSINGSLPHNMPMSIGGSMPYGDEAMLRQTSTQLTNNNSMVMNNNSILIRSMTQDMLSHLASSSPPSPALGGLARTTGPNTPINFENLTTTTSKDGNKKGVPLNAVPSATNKAASNSNNSRFFGGNHGVGALLGAGCAAGVLSLRMPIRGCHAGDYRLESIAICFDKKLMLKKEFAEYQQPSSPMSDTLTGNDLSININNSDNSSPISSAFNRRQQQQQSAFNKRRSAPPLLNSHAASNDALFAENALRAKESDILFHVPEPDIGAELKVEVPKEGCCHAFSSSDGASYADVTVNIRNPLLRLQSIASSVSGGTRGLGSILEMITAGCRKPAAVPQQQGSPTTGGAGQWPSTHQSPLLSASTAAIEERLLEKLRHEARERVPVRCGYATDDLKYAQERASLSLFFSRLAMEDQLDPSFVGRIVVGSTRFDHPAGHHHHHNGHHHVAGNNSSAANALSGLSKNASFLLSKGANSLSINRSASFTSKSFKGFGVTTTTSGVTCGPLGGAAGGGAASFNAAVANTHNNARRGSNAGSYSLSETMSTLINTTNTAAGGTSTGMPPQLSSRGRSTTFNNPSGTLMLHPNVQWTNQPFQNSSNLNASVQNSNASFNPSPREAISGAGESPSPRRNGAPDPPVGGGAAPVFITSGSSVHGNNPFVNNSSSILFEGSGPMASNSSMGQLGTTSFGYQVAVTGADEGEDDTEEEDVVLPATVITAPDGSTTTVRPNIGAVRQIPRPMLIVGGKVVEEDLLIVKPMQLPTGAYCYAVHIDLAALGALGQQLLASSNKADVDILKSPSLGAAASLNPPMSPITGGLGSGGNTTFSPLYGSKNSTTAATSAFAGSSTNGPNQRQKVRLDAKTLDMMTRQIDVSIKVPIPPEYLSTVHLFAGAESNGLSGGEGAPLSGDPFSATNAGVGSVAASPRSLPIGLSTSTMNTARYNNTSTVPRNASFSRDPSAAPQRRGLGTGGMLAQNPHLVEEFVVQQAASDSAFYNNSNSLPFASTATGSGAPFTNVSASTSPRRPSHSHGHGHNRHHHTDGDRSFGLIRAVDAKLPISFAVGRERDMCFRQAHVVAPFSPAISTQFRYFWHQGTCFVSVTLTNTLKESVIAIHAVELVILDKVETFNICRKSFGGSSNRKASAVSEHPLFPSAKLSVLFELKPSPNFVPKKQIEDHSAKAVVHYSTWEAATAYVESADGGEEVERRGNAASKTVLSSPSTLSPTTDSAIRRRDPSRQRPTFDVAEGDAPTAESSKFTSVNSRVGGGGKVPSSTRSFGAGASPVVAGSPPNNFSLGAFINNPKRPVNRFESAICHFESRHLSIFNVMVHVLQNEYREEQRILNANNTVKLLTTIPNFTGNLNSLSTVSPLSMTGAVQQHQQSPESALLVSPTSTTATQMANIDVTSSSSWAFAIGTVIKFVAIVKPDINNYASLFSMSEEPVVSPKLPMSKTAFFEDTASGKAIKPAALVDNEATTTIVVGGSPKNSAVLRPFVVRIDVDDTEWFLLGRSSFTVHMSVFQGATITFAAVPNKSGAVSTPSITILRPGTTDEKRASINGASLVSNIGSGSSISVPELGRTRNNQGTYGLQYLSSDISEGEGGAQLVQIATDVVQGRQQLIVY